MKHQHQRETNGYGKKSKETRPENRSWSEARDRFLRQERPGSGVQAFSAGRQSLQGSQGSRPHQLILGLLVACLFLLVQTFSPADLDASETTQTWARAALARCPTPHADSSDLNLIAAELARQVPSRRKVALLVAIGCQESHYDKRIIAGQCRPWECDHGKARGAWQGQRNRDVTELWDIANGNIPAQVEMAHKTLNHSMIRCVPFGPFPGHVFRAYRGGSCSWALKDEGLRSWIYDKAIRQTGESS